MDVYFEPDPPVRRLPRSVACAPKRVRPIALAFGLFATGAALALELPKTNMQLTSPVFEPGGSIPARYTCDDRDVSPPLKWSGAPAGVKSFALLADDPDAPVGTWVHWVLYDLPPDTTELSENVPKTQSIAGDARQGINDFRRIGYGGPCPPPGKPHRYFFRLYALDVRLGLKPGATRKEVERAMEKHIVGRAELMGTYQRR
jgi:Raf kinase inhibitor-like YbhB/YbcL family protein